MARGRPKGSGGKPQLTESQRTRIRTLFFDGGLTKDEIHARGRGERSHSQIRTALAVPVPQIHERGRKPVLECEDFEKFRDFVTFSREGRRASWEKLEALSIQIVGYMVGWIAIRGAFYRHGYRRYHARCKPPLSEANRRKRLEWALEHEHWTVDQWRQILWTDETWVTGGHHKRVWVTRRK